MLHVARFAVVEAPKMLPVNELPGPHISDDVYVGSKEDSRSLAYIVYAFFVFRENGPGADLVFQRCHLAGYFVKTSCLVFRAALPCFWSPTCLLKMDPRQNRQILLSGVTKKCRKISHPYQIFADFGAESRKPRLAKKYWYYNPVAQIFKAQLLIMLQILHTGSCRKMRR